MAQPERPPYDERDYAIIANNVLNQLCHLPDGWHDIRPLAKTVGGYTNSDDVAYIAEIVLSEKEYTERNPENHDVRLTKLGRDNCGRDIEIPPSDIQRLMQRFRERGL